MGAEVVPITNLSPARRTPADLKLQAEEVRELQRAVLVEGVDFGKIPGVPKPSLFKAGAEWLLRWACYGHKLTQVAVERDENGKPFGVTYCCTVHVLERPEMVVATADGYAGYDEPDREAHVSAKGKDIPRAPWNTIIKMSQKRALVAATLQATATSGLFTQDMEDVVPTVPATKEQRAEIQAEIDKLGEHQKSWLKAQWNERKLPPLTHAALTDRQLPLLRALIASAAKRSDESSQGADEEKTEEQPEAERSCEHTATVEVEEGVVYCESCGERLAG